jgi:hypothetical protein
MRHASQSRSFRLPLPALVAALLAGCASIAGNEQKLLEETLESYASVIRWGNIEEAMSFVDPATLKAHPVSKLDLARYHQVQVTAYNAQPPRHVGEHEVRQAVEIGLVNVNTQSARAIIDTQLWRYDAQAKRWWLETGLPDITAR